MKTAQTETTFSALDVPAARASHGGDQTAVGPSLGQDVKVLVDAYNLQLPHGTGIKTYGMTLIRALRRLNCDISLLYSRNIGRSKSPILNELIFRDSLISGGSPRSARAQEARRIASALLNWSEPVIEAPYTGHIQLPRAGFEVGATQYTAPRCFEDSMRIHQLLQREITLSTPRKMDIFHATYPLPIKVKGAKRITTIHDIIPIILPNLTLDRKEEIFLRHQTVIRESDLIITVSEASKRDILNIFDVPEDKVVVTYQPIDITDVRPEEEGEAEDLLRTLKLEKEKYYLFVGAIEPKKNVRALINAYATMQTDHKLVIVGKKAWLWEGQVGHLEAVFGKNWPNRVKLLDYMSYNHVRFLMKNAGCFVFPSLYEGFGLPALEAMSMGTPVITSNTSSLPEVCGAAALYSDPRDEHELAKQMDRVANNPVLRANMSAAGLQQAQKFSLDAYLQRLTQAYAKVL